MPKKKLDPEALAEAFKNFQTSHECKSFLLTKIKNRRFVVQTVSKNQKT